MMMIMMMFFFWVVIQFGVSYRYQLSPRSEQKKNDSASEKLM
jgi:hypothetical protein